MTVEERAVIEAEIDDLPPSPNGHSTRGILEEFGAWLAELTRGDASDLHVKVATPPKMRVSGVLLPIDRSPLTDEETGAIAAAIIPPDRRHRFETVGEVDFAYSLRNVGRFRVNVFRQRGSISAVFRKLRFGGPTFEEMHLPDAIRQLSEEHRGLVLVTGPTGSGKTTTLAAMIEHLNHIRQCHVVTIEDPIEVLFRDDLASINQREVGNDTESFLSALRAALRQDPDVILIGEMRDTETVRAALQAAETGHLVLSTLHTVDATETVNRVVDFFPPHQQTQIRLTLAGALRGIVCQRLVPTVEGGLRPCHEILVNTGRIAERIADPDRTAEIHEVIAEGEYYGMLTFDQSLLQLVKAGHVTIDAALAASTSPHDLQLQLQQAGVAAA
jgi:twitching motility protein PilT